MHSHTHVFGFDVVMSQIKAITEDAQPLLAEVRDGGLLKEVETLTKSLTQASEDLRLVVSPFLALPLYFGSYACTLHGHKARQYKRYQLYCWFIEIDDSILSHPLLSRIVYTNNI